MQALMRQRTNRSTLVLSHTAESHLTGEFTLWVSHSTDNIPGHCCAFNHNNFNVGSIQANNLNSSTYHYLKHKNNKIGNSMGSVCYYYKSQRLGDYSRPAQRVNDLTSCHVAFSMAKIQHLSADCLVMFVDDNFHADRNFFLKQVGQGAEAKVQNYLNAHLLQKQMVAGDFAVLKVEIPNVSAQYIAILCVQVWPGGEGELMAPLQEDIEEVLEALAALSLRKLIITQVNPELGIPLQVAQKTLCNSIMMKQNHFDEIVVLCRTEETMKFHSEMMTKLNSGLRGSLTTTNSNKSDYY